ncbi:MAG: hypothetical protein JJP05_00195 [cyanobacterium endosymbiont of Rhopalodia gibba]
MARVKSASLIESGAMKVKIEVDIAGELPSINIIGLLDTVVQKFLGFLFRAQNYYQSNPRRPS